MAGLCDAARREEEEHGVSCSFGTVLVRQCGKVLGTGAGTCHAERSLRGRHRTEVWTDVHVWAPDNIILCAP